MVSSDNAGLGPRLFGVVGARMLHSNSTLSVSGNTKHSLETLSSRSDNKAPAKQ